MQLSILHKNGPLYYYSCADLAFLAMLERAHAYLVVWSFSVLRTYVISMSIMRLAFKL